MPAPAAKGKTRKTPPGYRVTVRAEAGLWAFRLWRRGQYLLDSALLYTYKDQARKAGQELAAKDYAANAK